MLYSRTLLFIHPIYNGLHLLTLTLKPSPFCLPAPLVTTVCSLHENTLDFYMLSHGRTKWQPTPVFLPGKSHGQRSLYMGHKESDTTEQLNHHIMKPCLDTLISSHVFFPTCNLGFTVLKTVSSVVKIISVPQSE